MTDAPASPLPAAASAPAVKRSRRGRSITDEHGRVRIIARAKKPGPKKGKYNAKGKHIDGIWFASSAEADRYLQLVELEKQGRIENLRCQVKYAVALNNVHICNYIADFAYTVVDDLGRTLRDNVEDVKGMVMDLYKLKRKLVEAQHSIRIIEIPAGKVKEWADTIP